MILPDGSDFPRDYAYPITGKTYVHPDGERRLATVTPMGRAPRLTYLFEDHPVVRAYAALSTSLDMRKRDHREAYLSFLAIAIPQDDYDVVSSQSGRIVDAVQEANKMDDLESMLARLDTCERRQDSLDAIQSDDALAQGLAMARSGHGSMTVEVSRVE